MSLPERAALWDRRRYIHFYGEAFGNAAQNSRTQLVEEAPEPTEDAWARMREMALAGYASWLAELDTHEKEHTL